ncbi:MAG: DUF309 domain-containing protein [Nitrosopumilaceae archaeon]
MDRFMIHLKNTGYVPSDSHELLLRAREITANMKITIRDMRVSSRYLEFDVSIPKDRLEQLIKKLEPIGPLDHAKHVIDEPMGKEETIEKGRYYFNYERFWECHEVLEGAWKKSEGKEKELIQGIILVDAALVHYQKNENEICLSIFNRALKKIGNAKGKYHKIDVDTLRNKVSSMVRTGVLEAFTI